jgi:hypothetical protein
MYAFLDPILPNLVFSEVPMADSQRPQANDSAPKKERRSWNRVPVQVTVFCRNTQGEDELYWSARIMDISRGGIKLLSPQKFQPTTLLRIGKDENGDQLSEYLDAVVVRAHHSPGENWTIGCALSKEMSEAELQAWIEKNCKVK